MNHLDETLEVVLSRGDNLTLDNKVRQSASCWPNLPFTIRFLDYSCGFSVDLLSCRSCCLRCCQQNRKLDLLCVGGCMRSCSTATAACLDCCQASFCTKPSQLGSSPSSPPTSALSDSDSPTGGSGDRQVTLLCFPWL